jgi:hypothetical protein
MWEMSSPRVTPKQGATDGQRPVDQLAPEQHGDAEGGVHRRTAAVRREEVKQEVEMGLGQTYTHFETLGMCHDTKMKTGRLGMVAHRDGAKTTRVNSGGRDPKQLAP